MPGATGKGFQTLDARFGLREKIPSYEGWIEDPDHGERIPKVVHSIEDSD